MTMGCYGIGVSRVVAAAIEQNHDDRGIIWPDAMAPFQLAIVPLNMQKSEAVARCAEELYGQLQAAGIDVAVRTGLVAQLAHVDLEDLDAGRVQLFEAGTQTAVTDPTPLPVPDTGSWTIVAHLDAASGLVAGGLVADGLVADGLVADGLQALCGRGIRRGA